MEKESPREKAPTGLVVRFVSIIVIVPLLPILISGQWGWWEAWTYAFLNIGGFAASRLLAARRNPDIITERATSLQKKDTLPWDRFLAPLVGIGGGLIPLVVGIEALLGRAMSFGLFLRLAALFFLTAGYVIASYALVENRFFSGVVRLQTDRGQHVVSSGPYRWVRHPGYAGALLSYFTIPIFMEAVWAHVPVLIITVLLVVRTGLEDRTLQEHLEGYAEYSRRVKYRLVPGLW